MLAKEAIKIGKICVGCRCSWDAPCNDGLEKAEGVIVRVPKYSYLPYVVKGCYADKSIPGLSGTFVDTVWLEENESFHVYPNWSLQDGK